MEKNTFDDIFENNFNLKDFLSKYVVHWKWFVSAVSVCVFVAFLYLRFTIPQYEAKTSVLVKDDKKGGMLSELSAFSDMGIGMGMKSNLDNEIEILKSRTLIESTVKKLNLNTDYIIAGEVVDSDVYLQSPVRINFFDKTNRFYESSVVFEIKYLTSNLFEIGNSLVNEDLKLILSAKARYHYGEIIPTIFGGLIITKSNVDNSAFIEGEKSITIVLSPLENVVQYYSGALIVEALSMSSSVVSISTSGPVKKKSEDFLDNLVETYNDEAAADKNFISENTSSFIASRLALITEELDGVEQNVESFKKSNNITDVESEAALFVAGSNEYDKKGVETEIQLNVVSSMLDFMKKSSNTDLLPTNIMTNQGSSSGLINSYNDLVLNRNRILKTATAINPSVLQLNEQIASLKNTVQTSLLRMQSSLNIEKRKLNNEEEILNGKINKIPIQERQFRSIARQQKVKEELYLYLLQKREEAAISLSASEPNARVIDAAKANKTPISPNNQIVYAVGIVLGLLIPFLIIYLDDLLDTKIKSRSDFEGKTLIPFIGDVPISANPLGLLQQSESRTSSAEALRIISTNLEFMLNDTPDGVAKTIFVTSTFPKEGKTFVASNLAATFAQSGSKVLLIGMDIRNPKLNEYFNLPKQGLTNYLLSNDLKIADLIVKCPGYEDLYVLTAGTPPPNPMALLKSKKVALLLNELKSQYDYIIVDTPPVTLVTDTLVVAKYADCFVYVVRANFLEKRMLNVVNTLDIEGKLPNMCMLLNYSDSTKGYGYGYGYGHQVETQKPWYKKRFKK
jgi:capsular exopolysaccharide synthesis family protein